MRTIEQVDAELQIAEARAATAREEGASGTPVYRETPACEMRCSRCDIGCAILQGEAYDLRRERETLAAFPVFIHNGRHFMETEGRA